MEKQKLNISCDTVTLAVFMDCMFDGNYIALAANATDDERKALWHKLSEEYSQKSGDMKQQYVFSLMRRIALKEARITAFGIALHLSFYEAEKLLKGFGYTGGVARVKSRVDHDKITLAADQRELKKMLERESKRQSTRVDFIQWITVVSKFMGYRIDPAVVTITEFLSMDKMFKESLKQQSNRIRK